jgi:hypothetical protein
MADLKKHQGGCHCGKVRYEVETDMAQVLSCNCSICQKRGALLSFVGASEFKLLSGGDALTDYQFNKKVIHHLFCNTCGVGSFARGIGPGGKEMVAINVRCLDDVELGALKPMPFDGKSM